MPNLGEDAVTGWFREAGPAGMSSTSDAIRPVERVAEVGAAIEALGTDLDDAYSRDPARFYANLAGDALRQALTTLLCSLGRARALSILHWMAASAPSRDRAPLIDIVAGEGGLADVIEQEVRRRLFDRILGADRLALLLSACSSPGGAEAT